MRRNTMSAMLLLLSAGCGRSERQEYQVQQPKTQAELDERLCEKSVARELINPETLEFFEFERVAREDSRYKTSALEETFSNLSNFRQYHLRYKTDSKVGLKVTSVERCYAYRRQETGEMCTCTEEL